MLVAIQIICDTFSALFKPPSPYVTLVDISSSPSPPPLRDMTKAFINLYNTFEITIENLSRDIFANPPPPIVIFGDTLANPPPP
jgi:hypothetical protein